VVLDIEGTTTPVSFVYDVLFPYAREHLRDYIAARVGAPELAEPVRLLSAEWEEDFTGGEDPPPDMMDVERDPRLECVVGYALWLMQRDRKSPGLKLLQGLIWDRGYRDGTLRGEVYPDVPLAFQRWHSAGATLAIYSSGSVLAQKLLFSTTRYGDLTPYLSAFFDTGVGAKHESESYGRIAAAMSRRPAELLFVSDVEGELEAARQSGMVVALCQRDSTSGARHAIFDLVRTFGEIHT
jgi:enolase-phosphatase E1